MTDLKPAFMAWVIRYTDFGVSIDAFLRAFSHTHFARGYDFDPEIAVRIFWQGVRPIQIDIPVRYLDASEGGCHIFTTFGTTSN